MGHRLSKIIAFGVAACAWLACERSVELNAVNFGRASLEVVWNREAHSHFSYKDSAKVRLYDNEADFLQAGGHFVAERSLSDRSPQGGGTITPVDRGLFENLAPSTYWVKVFNAYDYERMIEHNLDAGFKTALELQEHTHNSVYVETKTVYLQTYHIHSITFHTLPMAEEFLSPNQNFQLDIDKWYEYTSSQYPDIKFYSGSSRIGDLPMTINGLDIPIFEFTRSWPRFYINVGRPNAEGIYGQYEIRLFDLLNQNTSLTGDLHYWDEQGRKIFTLHGTFTFQD